MKALVQERYGSPLAVLRVADVERPRMKDGEVLVRIHVAALNALDWHTTRGRPRFIRPMIGIRTPRQRIRGVDLAGRVEAVGKAVTAFAPGDAVLGGCDGSFAEYAVTKPERLVRRPDQLRAEEAAGLYVAGLTALQGLRDKARVGAGQKVLVNGAGGGVGTFAVQLAKYFGASVTAVTRTESVDLVRSLGADEVIDHRHEDFTRRSERYDVLFDIGGNRSLAEFRRVLAKRGTFVSVSALASCLFGAVALAPVVGQRFVFFISKNDSSDLAVIRDLVATGVIRVVIDREYPLADAAEAIRHMGEGHARGKVVIKIATPA